MTKYAGIVEGFYWIPNNAILGQHSEFDFTKRIKLLNFMGRKKLNVYLYDPKLLRKGNHIYERSYNLNLIGKINQWKKTFYVAKKNNINFIWGIAPGSYNPFQNFHPGWKNKEKDILKNIEVILSLGANQVALLFDDSPGTNSDLEKKKQAELAEKINNCFPNKLYAMCPAVYCGTKQHFEKNNNILNENMSYKIPLMFTGHKVWNIEIKKDDVPQYRKRKIILWDNWMASDTSDPNRLSLSPPLNRDKKMYKKIHSYLLNPCFPVERIIPIISAVSQMHKHKGIYINKKNIKQYKKILNHMSNDWAKFLKVKEKPLRKLIYYKNDLKINTLKKKEYKHIIKKWPSLEAIFETVK